MSDNLNLFDLENLSSVPERDKDGKLIFYINSFNDKSLSDKSLIGLFDCNTFYGEGHFCGWYSSEYYCVTSLYAYYEFDDPWNEPVNFKKNPRNFITLKEPITFSKIHIGSCYWEKKLKADTVEEAVEKFIRLKWKN